MSVADADLRWRDAGHWTSPDLVREVFMFESGDTRISASMYAHPARSVPCGLVVCPAWGRDGDYWMSLRHGLARRLAERGGAALIFDYPGQGESEGDPSSATMADVVTSALTAREEAARRHDVMWFFCGIRLGASVAALATRAESLSHLVMVEPVLEPEQYFRTLLRRARRVIDAPGATDEAAFGTRVPKWSLSDASDQARDVALALESFSGKGAVVGYTAAPLGDRFERCVVSRRSRSDPSLHLPLRDAVVGWAERVCAAKS